MLIYIIESTGVERVKEHQKRGGGRSIAEVKMEMEGRGGRRGAKEGEVRKGVESGGRVLFRLFFSWLLGTEP